LVSKFKRSIDLNKYLIVGIGNIGTDYFKTRHNLGFEALDFISDHFDSKFEKKRLGEVSKFTFKGKKNNFTKTQYLCQFEWEICSILVK